MDDPDFASFGEWIKSRRKALDLTQAELAQRSGCSVFALRKIESGERRPSKQLAQLLAVALEMPETNQPVFIRVARGELSLERLRSSLPGTKPASPSPTPVTHHLPLSPTPLLGRESELAAMEKIFNESYCRLLTLTGVGGIGKTRLGVEFAARRCSIFLGGAHYVSLASINSAELIVPAIAEALEFSFSGPADPKGQLFNHLARQVNLPALLVLDNFEHLLAQSSAAANLVAEILQRFSNIKILCTSRERLNLPGEWIYELHGLPIPPSEYVKDLEEYSAAVLFIQCAQRMNAQFELTEADKPVVARVCRLVEGIPLAIELAAAWVGMLSCQEIAREIETNIDFLTTSMRGIPERHRSLRAAFDHSWRLLSSAEQDTLSRLSVFRGGFDRLAAERVADASLPLLSSLVSKSLVQRLQEGRYDLHEVIRQYALARLDEDHSRCLETRDRHGEYYLSLASEYGKKMKSASQQATTRDMTLELDNLRTAWDWAIKQENFESIGRAVRSFGWYFEVVGLIYDGLDHLEPLVNALSDMTPRDNQMDKVLGSTLVQQGLLCFRAGQFARAQELYQKAVGILRPLDEQTLLAEALIFSGVLGYLNGDYIEARISMEEGLSYARAINDPWFSAYGIYNLGHLNSLMGKYQEGYEQMQVGLALWRTLGDTHSISLGLNFLVETQIELGLCEEAIIGMRENLALCELTKNRWEMGTTYRYLGLATLAAGQIDEAQKYLQQSLEVFGDYFKGWDVARTLTYLGDALFMAGNVQQAEKSYLDALSMARETRAIPVALKAAAGLARLSLSRGELETAYQLASHVLNQPASAHRTREISRQLVMDTEEQLGPDRVRAIKESAADQSLETIVDIYLGQ